MLLDAAFTLKGAAKEDARVVVLPLKRGDDALEQCRTADFELVRLIPR